MILLISSDEDSSITYFGNFLLQNNKQYVFLNQKYLLQGIDISNEKLTIFGKSYEISSFSGVLNRLSSFQRDDLSNLPSKYRHCFQLLDNIINNIMPNVMNKGFLGVSNDSKLLQLARVKINHIKKPYHLVVGGYNIQGAIKKYSFHSRHIVKSLSSIRSIVVEFEASKDIFPSSSKEPILIQELIEGKNIRVHVIDGVAIAIKITSMAIDYRYDTKNNVTGESIILPKNIENECILIAEQLKLRFCGIDLIERKNQYYLLEANPSPGWTYFEEMIDHKDMSHRLMNVLSQEE